MTKLPDGFVLDEEPIVAGLPLGFVLDEDEVVQHAPGVTGQRGSGQMTADEQESNIARKGFKVAGDRFNADLGTTVLQGSLLNFSDEILSGIEAPIDATIGLVTGKGPTNVSEAYDQALAFNRAKLAATREQRPNAALATEIGGALMTAKIPLGVISRAPTFGKAALVTAGSGTVMGGVGGFGAGEEGLENRLEEARTGMIVGGLAGGAAPAVGAGIGKLISPFQASNARHVMADYLRRQGIDVTAGQRTGNHALRYAESELGGQKAAEMLERQGEQFTAAALKRAGINADRATPDVINDAFTRIGNQFDGLASRNMLQPDQKMLTDVNDVLQLYHSLVPESQRAPIIQKVIDDLNKIFSLKGSNATNGRRGSSYQSLRSMLERGARSTNDSQLAQLLRGIKVTLDEAMERSIAKSNPRDLGAWREAGRQYRNMLVIEKAVIGAEESAGLGLISPSRLRNATVQQGRRNYARGKQDFAELARAGEALTKPLPSPGAAGQAAVRALSSSIPAIIGAGLGGTAAGLPGMVAGAAASPLLPKIVGALLMSKPGQAYMANRVITPELRAIANALVVSGGSAGGLLVAP